MKRTIKHSISLNICIILLILLLCLINCKLFSQEICRNFSDNLGSGKYPYNFRVIDDKLFAGGNLFNPVGHLNSHEKVYEFIKLLKSMGVTSIILLNVPSDKKESSFIKKISQKEGLKYFECPMSYEKVPDKTQTEQIMKLIEGRAYVHCNWGADRTGAIIAKYLRLKKNYSGYDAWRSVIKGGSCAGTIGGLKQKPDYKNLVLYFWPEIVYENEQVCGIYGIKYKKDK